MCQRSDKTPVYELRLFRDLSTNTRLIKLIVTDIILYRTATITKSMTFSFLSLICLYLLSFEISCISCLVRFPFPCMPASTTSPSTRLVPRRCTQLFAENPSVPSDPVTNMSPPVSPVPLSPSIDPNTFSSILSTVLSNVLSGGPPGTRGESLVLSQFTLLFFILFPTFLPVSLNVLLGSSLLLIGLTFLTTSIINLGPNLTPWITPTSTSSLLTSGPFSYVRHPIYSGLLFSTFGYSLITDSTIRLIIVYLLYMLLDKKSREEEILLKNKYDNEYENYMEEVRGGIIPDLSDIMKNLKLK